MNLNIIGNGFDLFHGLPSSYYYFGCFLINSNPEFYEELCKMYSLKYGKMVGPSIAHEYDYAVENIFWSNFENHLGEVDEYFIVDTYEDDLGLENDDPVQLEMNEHLIADKLKQCFVQWVKNTLDVDENYKLIKNTMGKEIRGMGFKKDDYFLQFNYTHTLQELYKISESKIHYIHGECIEGEEDLIIGHGNNDRIQEIKKEIESMENQYNFSQESRNRIDEHKCLLRYIENMKKDVEFCKFTSQSFYESFKDDVSEVVVFGMSLGNVDIPYFVQIRKMWPNAKWKFSYYSKEDKCRAEEIAASVLMLDVSSFATFPFSNNLSETVKKRIIEIHSIETYTAF